MLANGAVRGLQILFGIIVLGLSVSMIREQIVVSAPSQTTYAAFCGAFSILIGAIGFVALFVSALEGFISAVLDSLAAALSLAAGIALAIAIKGSGNCSNYDFNAINRIIAGSWYSGNLDSGEYYSGPAPNPYVSLPGRCHQAQAITAFLLITAVAFGATAVMAMMMRRRPRVGSY